MHAPPHDAPVWAVLTECMSCAAVAVRYRAACCLGVLRACGGGDGCQPVLQKHHETMVAMYAAQATATLSRMK